METIVNPRRYQLSTLIGVVWTVGLPLLLVAQESRPVETPAAHRVAFVVERGTTYEGPDRITLEWRSATDVVKKEIEIGRTWEIDLPAKAYDIVVTSVPSSCIHPPRAKFKDRPNHVHKITGRIFPAGTLEIVLNDSRGTPVSRSIDLVSRDGTVHISGKSGTDGRCLFANIPALEYRQSPASGSPLLGGDGAPSEFAVARGATTRATAIVQADRRVVLVEISLEDEGEPVGVEDLDHITIEWDGSFFPVVDDSQRRGAGCFRAQCSVAAVPVRPMVINVAGPGVRPTKLEIDPSKTREDRVSLSCRVERKPHRLEGVVVDDAGRPVSGLDFTLAIASSQEGRYFHKSVRSLPDGTFHCSHVEFPLTAYVAAIADRRIVASPSSDRPRALRNGETLLVRTRTKGRLLLSHLSAKRDLGRAADVAVPEALIDIRRLDLPEAFDHLVGNLERRVASDKLRLFLDGKELDLGPLSCGRYAITMVVHGYGTATREVEIKNSSEDVVVDVRFETSLEPIRGRLALHERERAIVVDGRVPVVMMGDLLRWCDRSPSTGDVAASVAPDGAFRLPCHSGLAGEITILLPDRGAYRIAKNGDLSNIAIENLRGLPSLRGEVKVEGTTAQPIAVFLGAAETDRDQARRRGPRPCDLVMVPVGADGRFTFHGIDPGAYTICAATIAAESHGKTLRRLLNWFPDSVETRLIGPEGGDLSLHVTIGR